jgi:Uma2 family endonuclease
MTTVANFDPHGSGVGAGGGLTSRSPAAEIHLHAGLNGVTLAPWEFDEASAEPGYRYELIHGVLIVNPAPREEERDPNEELGLLLRLYQRTNPEGKSLDATLPEHDVVLIVNRRRVDRAIWCGLGRLPRRGEVPTICVEFVSSGRRNQTRDYLKKRSEYKLAGVREYWIIDRFARQLVAIRFGRGDDQETIVAAGGEYQTPQLPGFTLPLDTLLAAADRWEAT